MQIHSKQLKVATVWRHCRDSGHVTLDPAARTYGFIKIDQYAAKIDTLVRTPSTGSPTRTMRYPMACFPVAPQTKFYITPVHGK
jgi:hypothetical protein